MHLGGYHPMSSVAALQRELDRRKGQRDQVREALERTKERVRSLRRLQKNLEQAQVVLQRVAQQTQEELEWRVSELVTLALASVFEEDPYEFKIRFVQRRGKTEADLLFIRNGVEVDPLSASGGGAADVASFALRVALWRLQSPRSRPVLVLDEPFRFLSRNLQPLAGALLKELSDRLHLQIIMVTHSPDLIEAADQVFTTKFKEGETVVFSS